MCALFRVRGVTDFYRKRGVASLCRRASDSDASEDNEAVLRRRRTGKVMVSDDESHAAELLETIGKPLTGRANEHEIGWDRPLPGEPLD